MKTNITLRDPFSYSLELLIILAVIVLLPPLIFLIVKIIILITGKNKKKIKRKKIKKLSNSEIERLRVKCLQNIKDIENRYKSNVIDYRAAYIELSYIVREFVQTVSGNNASNLTLSEIKELSAPDLYALIEEFYEPEFAMDNNENEPENPFADAGKVIEKWN